MTGWISLHRSVEDHWLFQEKRKFSKFEAWVDLLLMVNHKDNKVMFDNELILVKRGQRITSIRQLGERWDWSRTKVDSFLKLLESDGMILTKKDTKKTLLSIVNYDLYQNEDLQKRHQKDTEKPRKSHDNDTEKPQKDTNNNDNNVNNELITNNNDNKQKHDNKQKQRSEYEQRVGRIFKAYEYFGFGFATPAANDQINIWLEKNNPEIIIEALREAYNEDRKKHNYVNSILTRWETEGLDTVEKVKADKRKFELSKIKKEPVSYQQKMKERPGEKPPNWIDKAKEKSKEESNEPVKTAADDPEIQKMIAEFRNAE